MPIPGEHISRPFAANGNRGAVQTVEVLPFEKDAAERTGYVLGTLASQGIPIGDFDAQIAGHALALNIPLATLNQKHFSRIPDLELMPWNEE